jgi:hypothetical protein
VCLTKDMTDNYLSGGSICCNRVYAILLNETDKFGRYINRETWKEELFEDKYQFEEFENEEFQNKNFNNLIEERTRGEAVFDLDNGYTPSNVTVKLDSEEKNHSYLAYVVKPGVLDVINNVYLEIELDNKFDDIAIKEKCELLNINVGFVTGGAHIDAVQKLVTCICNQICYGYSVKEYDNVIQIPLYNFDTYIDEKYNVKGYPMYLLKFSVILYINNNIINRFKYKIIVNGQVYPKEVRNRVTTSKYNHIILQSQHDTRLISDDRNLFKFKLTCSNVVKYILVYFLPKRNIDFWEMNENYPIIQKIALYADRRQVLEFENEDLLSIEIFGIKIYLLPLCKEFSSFEKIHETLKNPLKKLSSSGLNLSFYSSYIEIKFENESLNQYQINVICVNLNCMRVAHSCTNLSFDIMI